MKKLLAIGLLILAGCGKEPSLEKKADSLIMQAIIEHDETRVPTGEGQKGWSLPKPQSPMRKKGS